MFLHKLHAAAHLLWLLIKGNAKSLCASVVQGPRATCLEIQHVSMRIWLGIMATLFLRSRVRVTRFVRICRASGVSRAELEANLEAAVALAETDIGRQRYDHAMKALTPHIETTTEHPRIAKCLAVRSLAHIWNGRHQETVDDLNRCAALRPTYAQGFNYLANLAQVHGIRGEVTEARQAMAQQCGATPGEDPTPFLTRYIEQRVTPYLKDIPKNETVGVMFAAYHTAVGHAILDPFHFYNLFRHRFDHLAIVHPPLEHYSKTTLLMTDIMSQYLNTIEIASGELAPFAWQNLGELHAGNATFLFHNYWSLNRNAFRARNNPKHPMSTQRKHVTLPQWMIDRAERFCKKNRLEINQPVVVLHTRSHGYHNLKVQSFRNVSINNYIPALRRLVELGYKIIRIGDTGMVSLRGDVPSILELPFLNYYDASLDPYFLSQCKFMMSCQSGPCSIARALGKPNLIINAVYHHTMLPEVDELFLFKQYRDTDGTPLSLEEILGRGGHLCDKSTHFAEAFLTLEDASASEILAATEEMIADLHSTGRVDKPNQAKFREMMMRFAKMTTPLHKLANRMTDYIGYSLPEGRVSNAMCEMRPGYINHLGYQKREAA